MVALTLLILKIFVCSKMPKNIARSVPGGHGGRGGGSARSKKSINSKTSSYLCGGRVSGHGLVIRGASSGQCWSWYVMSSYFGTFITVF